jgi:hypothetical protein
MHKFNIDVEISREPTRVHVNEVLSEYLDMRCISLLVINSNIARPLITFTIKPKNGTWFFHNTLLSKENSHFRYFEQGPEQAWNPEYQSPLNDDDLKVTRMVISNHMIILPINYMGFLCHSFATKTLN